MFGIPGLVYLPNYVDVCVEQALIDIIDASPWRSDLARRTQHYGYVYDYRAKHVDASTFLGELPAWLADLGQQLTADGLLTLPPDQAIINEYQPGQGIADHIDCVPCFADTVISVSLGSAVVMDLKRDRQHIPILLEPQSVLILRGDARYAWTHGIAKRQTDTYAGRLITRDRRLSITFRRVILA